MKPAAAKHVDAVVREHRQRRGPVSYSHLGCKFTISPTVFSPFIAPSGYVTLAFAGLPIFTGKRVLDMGCGAGLFAILAAKSGAKRAVGIDISPDAVADAKRNAKEARVGITTRFFVGDLFEPLTHGERFDVVFADLPFANREAADMLDRAFFDPGLSTLRRFTQEVRGVLAKRGTAYLCTSDLDQYDVYTDFRHADRSHPISRRFMTVDLDWIRMSVAELLST